MIFREADTVCLYKIWKGVCIKSIKWTLYQWRRNRKRGQGSSWTSAFGGGRGGEEIQFWDKVQIIHNTWGVAIK
jgi:hypothetical protein